MPNTCQIVITRGKNKGKACSDVNKKCRHKNVQCPHCGIRFTVETSFTRHRSRCNPGSGSGILGPIILGPGLPDPVPKKYVMIKIKIPTNIHVKTPHDDTMDNNMLLQKIEKLERALEVVKNTPTTVQHHHWNIVLGMNFFDELVTKMGKSSAINYLTGIVQEGKPMDVINKLYLEGTCPTKYPIACRDQDHFRYINSDHRLIDDKGGHGISRLVSTGVCDALILAANEVLKDEEHNVESIQHYVQEVKKSPPARIINELSDMTSIPNHPFFTDEDSFRIDCTLDNQ